MGILDALLHTELRDFQGSFVHTEVRDAQGAFVRMEVRGLVGAHLPWGRGRNMRYIIILVIMMVLDDPRGIQSNGSWPRLGSPCPFGSSWELAGAWVTTSLRNPS